MEAVGDPAAKLALGLSPAQLRAQAAPHDVVERDAAAERFGERAALQPGECGLGIDVGHDVPEQFDGRHRCEARDGDDIAVQAVQLDIREVPHERPDELRRFAVGGRRPARVRARRPRRQRQRERRPACPSRQQGRAMVDAQPAGRSGSAAGSARAHRRGRRRARRRPVTARARRRATAPIRPPSRDPRGDAGSARARRSRPGRPRTARRRARAPDCGRRKPPDRDARSAWPA